MGVKHQAKNQKVVPSTRDVAIILHNQVTLEVEMPNPITHVHMREGSYFSLLSEVVSLILIFCELSRIKWLEWTLRPPFPC